MDLWVSYMVLWQHMCFSVRAIKQVDLNWIERGKRVRKTDKAGGEKWSFGGLESFELPISTPDFNHSVTRAGKQQREINQGSTTFSVSRAALLTLPAFPAKWLHIHNSQSSPVCAFLIVETCGCRQTLGVRKTKQAVCEPRQTKCPFAAPWCSEGEMPLWHSLTHPR